MSEQPLAVLGTAMVTSVGLNAPAACAAIRVGVTNPSETRFLDAGGEWMMAHAVPLPEQLQGVARVAQMAAMAIDECVARTPIEDWTQVRLILCVADSNRPGRFESLDEQLFEQIREVCNSPLPAAAKIIAHGRVAAAVALHHARKMIYEEQVRAVLIVGADSLLSWPTLNVYEDQERLLTTLNSNGFMAGEAAAAVVVGRPGPEPLLRIEGLGFAVEAAPIDSNEPLRGDGLSAAIVAALGDAGCDMAAIDFRISDISGEQYYFKEAALALSRVLRIRKEEFDLWHPAECIGETGSAIVPAMLAVADASCRKNYGPGKSILLHSSGDSGQRAAIVARYGAA